MNKQIEKCCQSTSVQDRGKNVYRSISKEEERTFSFHHSFFFLVEIIIIRESFATKREDEGEIGNFLFSC
ncbi:hypothetical protein ANTQUA_LOCUS2566 [Anthophora quadrimaculata]